MKKPIGRITPVKKTPEQIVREQAATLSAEREPTPKQRLVPIQPSTGRGSQRPRMAGRTPRPWDQYVDKIKKLARKYPVFMIAVLVPNIIYAFYLFAIASPQYISEAHFMVRTDKPSGGGGAAAAMMGASGGGGSETTNAVLDYMKSRDAMNLLIDHGILKDVFSRPGADFIARFPNFYTSNNREAFFGYYKSHVKADINGDTSLPVLRVRTFTPEDSYRIANMLMHAAEDLVNRINVRLRQDTIAAAKKEFDADLTRMKDVQVRIAMFRDANSIIDPDKQSQSYMGSEYALRSILAATKMKLEQTRITAPNSPAITVYEHQIETIEHQLKSARSDLTGSETSLVPKLRTYDSLLVEKQLLDKVLATEITSLETARAQADRHMVFLESITKPSFPDAKGYPKKLKFMSVCILASLGCYFMYRILAAGAREHDIS